MCSWSLRRLKTSGKRNVSSVFNIPRPTIFNFLALTNSLVKRNRSRVRKIQDSPPKNGISRLFFLVERWDDMWLLERLKLFSILRVWLLSRHFTALNFFSFERWHDAIFPLKRLKQLYHCSLLYFESSEIGKVPFFLHVPKRPTIIFLCVRFQLPREKM